MLAFLILFLAYPLGMLVRLCSVVEAWLAADPHNVAAISCMTGRGRTAVVAACALAWMGEAATPLELRLPNVDFGDLDAALTGAASGAVASTGLTSWLAISDNCRAVWVSELIAMKITGKASASTFAITGSSMPCAASAVISAWS